jgi:Trk K+ transport system NAD-binding subunit
MKFLPAELAYLMGQREVRQNLKTLRSYCLALAATVAVFSVTFHWIMLSEDQEHSLLTGLYWTLTVMSTLGFGDITFHSDLGRAFSILVLLTGIVMLLIVLPFVFIRSFYAPWLEAQLHLRAPRALDEAVRGHVVLCRYDEIARELIPRLEALRIPYVVIESDPPTAADMHANGVNVIAGSAGAPVTWQNVRIEDARAVIATWGDPENTNITITVREASADVPVIVLAEDHDSIDVLELAGATEVLPIKYRLGEHLAGRVVAGTPHAHRIGRYEELVIAEFPVHGTALAGRTLRETNLRKLTGLAIVAVWEHGTLRPARPDTMLTESSVPVMVGTEDQFAELDAFFVIYTPNENPVLVIGGGKVGRAVAGALRERDVRVHIIDADPSLMPSLTGVADQVIIGSGSDRAVVKKAGIDDAPSVVLTTNDDATNIFLAVYGRKLDPDAHIISRVTHDWNLEAIHRAGADFALSYTALAVQSILSILRGRELVVLGEDAEVFLEPLPEALVAKRLDESGIAEATGLQVIALRRDGVFLPNPHGDSSLEAGDRLVMIGSAAQRRTFAERYI